MEQRSVRTPIARASPTRLTEGLVPGRPGATKVVAVDEGGWEALLWHVVERSNTPIVVLDENRNILDLNPPAAGLFGGVRAQLLGRTAIDRIHPAERGAAARDWHTLMRTGDLLGQRLLSREDGVELRVEWAARRARIYGRTVVIVVISSSERSPDPGPHGNAERALTRREREIVTLIALGRDTREIAAQLDISPETVKSHARNAMSAVQARTRAQLVAIALSRRLIPPSPQPT